MKFHFAHLNRIDVSVGQSIKKGQQIGLMGKTGTSSVHLHFEIVKKFRTYVSYTKNLTRSQVLEHYEYPYNCDWKSIAPFSHLGWDWLSDIGGGQLHPGIDINSGSGDTDLNTPIKSPINGKVVYASDDTASGWGKHIFIEEGDEMIPENLLAGRLERDPDGKVWWWTENSEWFHNRMDLCVQRPDYKQIIKDLENRPPEIKEVEKLVENPETLAELEKAKSNLISLQSEFTNEKTSLQSKLDIVKNELEKEIKNSQNLEKNLTKKIDDINIELKNIKENNILISKIWITNLLIKLRSVKWKK